MVFQDLSFAVRQLRKSPGFAFTAIVALALGVAASAAIFAFVDAALLQPLPYKDPSRLVAVYRSSNDCHECDLSYQDYLDLKKDNAVFRSLEAWDFSVFLFRSSALGSSAAGVQAVRGARVSGGFFRMLGVAPMLGRGFTDADDTPAAPRTAVLTYGAWRSRFGGRRDVVGQSVILNDSSYTVIGVLPRDFQFALRAAEFFATIHDLNSCERTRNCHSVYGIARLKDDVSVQAALAYTNAMAANLEKQYPDSNRGQGTLVKPLRDAIVGDIRPTLLVLLSGACLLSLIACVNVMSLLLVRAENRRREMALRSAVGASLGRLLRLFVAEGVVLAGFGVSVGLMTAYWTIPALFNLIPERRLRGMPYFRQVGLHPRSFWFAGAFSLLAVVAFSLTPALRLSLSNLRANLAEGGRGSAGTQWRRFGSNLVAVELAIAVVLLAIAGLLSKSLYRRLHVDLNFNPAHVSTLEIDVRGASDGQHSRRTALSWLLVNRISTMPGVVAAAAVSDLPVTCNCNQTQFRVVGHPWNGHANDALERETSTDYLKVFQARLIRGRFYTEADDRSKPPVVVINQTLAKLFFPDEDPIGKTIGDPELSPGSLKQIIGVVEGIREGELEDEIRPAVYQPIDPGTDSGFFLAVRTLQDPGPMLPVLAAAIHRIDPNVGVRNEFTMTQRIGNLQSAFLNRSSAWLVGGFAGIALLLGVIGLYGVVSYSVSQRTREIGVRMALGAERGAVYRLVLSEAAVVTAMGIVAGLGFSIVAAALLRHLLFGVEAWDISTLIAATAVLGICALLASFLPARRAASVNPVEALRAE